MLNTSHGAMQGQPGLAGPAQEMDFNNETHNVVVNQSSSAMGYGYGTASN